MSTQPFSGVFTAIVTPMDQGAVAFDDLQKLVEYQIDEGIDGLVVVGTTGESPTLDHKEHLEVVRKVIEVAAGRVPVIAGTGSNSTTEAVELTRKAHEAGADGMLQVTPYYNKPNQEGLYRHFSTVAEATDKPIILYSIPSRCGIEVGIETMSRLAGQFPHVRTIKESGGSTDRVSALLQAAGDQLTVLSGDDYMTLPFISAGAKGAISVASNLVVKDLVAMVRSALKNDYGNAMTLHNKYYSLFKNLFLEPNPVPIKYALKRAGIIGSDEVRLPLCEMSERNRKILDDTLDSLA